VTKRPVQTRAYGYPITYFFPRGLKRTGSTNAGASDPKFVLLASELKHNAGRVADVILMAAEPLGRAAQAGAVELRHDILDLNWLDRDVLCQLLGPGHPRPR
jgi:hypothetical protein